MDTELIFKSKLHELILTDTKVIFDGISCKHEGLIDSNMGRFEFGNYSAKYSNKILNLYLNGNLIDSLLLDESIRKMSITKNKNDDSNDYYKKYLISKEKFLYFDKENGNIIVDDIEYKVISMSKSACHYVYKTSYKELRIPFISNKPITWGNSKIFCCD